MKFLGTMDFQQNYLDNIAIRLDEAFPINPIVGQFVFKNKVLYICIEITNGLPVWCPLTKEITIYTHTQGIASETWTINHNLNTRGVIVTVYDSNDRVIIPDQIQVSNSNSVVVSVASNITGRAVVLTGHTDGNTAPSYAYEHYQTAPSTSWVINHNLDRNPIVRAFVGNQEVQPASITFTSPNTVTVTFSTAQSGYAKLI